MQSQPYTSDTSPESEAVQLELVRKMPAAKRVEKAIQLSNELLRLSKAAIRRRHPDFSEEEVGIKFVELHYGVDLATAMQHQLESR